MNIDLLTKPQPFKVRDKNSNTYVEIKDYKRVDLGVSATFYSHKSIDGKSYVVSEKHTGLKIESGYNEGIAIGRAKYKVSEFVKVNGEEAFLTIIRDNFIKNNPNTPYPEDKPVEAVKIIPIEEPKPVEEKELTLEDVLTNSLDYTNKVDLAYMANELGISEEVISERLVTEELAFINPENEELETNDEYLSGNVRDKLELAEDAFETNPSYGRNVKALKEVMPENIPSALIQYSLGAAWIPKWVFEQFALSIFKCKVSVEYVPKTGKFNARCMIPVKPIQVTSTYAGGGKNGVDIFTATLNNQQIIVSEKSVKNLEATASAQAMQEQIQEEFQQWIRVNKNIEEETEIIYNRKFNSHVARETRIPSFDYYPNASHNKKPMKHQKQGVLRSLNEATGIAHSMGLGKTLLSCTLAMEMRRLGIAKKPMLVVQNKTMGDFIMEFLELYPKANLFVPTEHDFTVLGRPYLYQRIRDEDFDAVIFPHSQFDLIPNNIERQRKNLREDLAVAYDIMEKVNKTISPLEFSQAKRAVKSLQKELDEIDVSEENRIQAQNKAFEQYGIPPLIDFEEMGIDALIIDEFTRYKVLGLQSSLTNVKGIPTAKSKRAQSCFLKMRWIQQNNNGKNTVVLTGTPLSNTMAEAWIMIKFLRPDILKEIGIEHFDQFAKTFGQIIPSLEQTGGGTFKIQNRFAKFQNLPEFIRAFLRTWDVVAPEDVPEFMENNTLPKLIGGQIEQVVVKRSEALVAQIAEFRKTLEEYEEMEGLEKRLHRHIPLVIYNKAKQASIDLRLLNPTYEDNPLSKVNQMIKGAYSKYLEKKLPQLIFCDLYQSPEPKNEYLDEDNLVRNTAYGVPRFNLFNDIKKKLIAKGVRADEIGILTEPKYDKRDKLSELYEMVNKGKVKFLMATTERGGIGVNVQRLLYWIHHLDAPQRPMDFTQRNARGIRQGNLNEYMGISAYGTEKTLDSAAFQRLGIKQRFINQVLKGKDLDRVMDDAADEAQLTFDEMMAHLSDSPFAMQKLLVDNKLKTERLKRDNFHAKQVQTNRQLNYITDDIEKLEIELKEQLKYSESTVKFFPDGEITTMKVGANTFTEHFTIEAQNCVEILLERYFASPSGSAKGVLFLNGAKVMLEINTTRGYSKKAKMNIDMPSLTYTIPDIGIFPSHYGNGISIPSNSGSGLMHSIGWKIKDAINEPNDTKKKIERYMVNAEELKRTLDNVYDETRLFELEAQIEVLKEKMLNEKSMVVE